MNRLYLISQSYKENSGSFSGFIEKVAKYANNLGYEVIIACGRVGNEPIKEDAGYAKIHRFQLYKWPIFNTIFNALVLSGSIKKYMKKQRIGKEDIIIANGEAAHGLKGYNFILRAGDQPIPVFKKNMSIAKVSFLSNIAREMHLNLFYLLEKNYFSEAQAYIFSSEETRQLFYKYYDSKNKPYFIPHSGVAYPIDQKQKKEEETKKLLFISAARSERIRKGVPYLEKALPALFEKYPNIILLHVGEKFKWDIPKKYLPRIESVGKVPWQEMPKIYNQADMLVSCSIHEMFPNTILEALCFGLPVITSDIQGAGEYIDHKKTGFIYKRGNADGLSEGVSYFLDNKIKEKERQIIYKKALELAYPNYLKHLFRFIISKESFNLIK
jgi:glycosyltransferase involved in cell wall biosynthesis